MLQMQSLYFQRIQSKSLPLKPNAETLAAIDEVQEMKRNPHLYKGFNSVEALFEDLNDGE
jgi:antitoxin component of RelBE/YafQ-DinJ toxin-antitoxin module